MQEKRRERSVIVIFVTIVIIVIVVIIVFIVFIVFVIFVIIIVILFSGASQHFEKKLWPQRLAGGGYMTGIDMIYIYRHT